MHRTVCFRRPLAGTPHHRYYIGRPDGQGGFTVSAVQLSHPGVELVLEPRRVTMPPPTLPDAAPIRGRERTRTPPVPLPDQKRCALCSEVKPAAHYYSLTIRGRLRLHAYCKPCHVARCRARKAAREGGIASGARS
jgi:hypothetical protein